MFTLKGSCRQHLILLSSAGTTGTPDKQTELVSREAKGLKAVITEPQDPRVSAMQVATRMQPQPEK